MFKRAAPITVALTLCACTGSLDVAPAVDAPADVKGPARPVPGMTSAPLDCAEAPIDPGPSPLQLLSREQYVNTLQDLFGARGDVAGVLDAVPLPSAFGLQQPDVSQVELEGFAAAATQVARKVTSEALEQVAPCSVAPRTCAREFITRFGARAYRAPLTDDADIERHLALYDAGAKTSHAHGMELLLRGMLQSPRFLYRVELGTERRVSDRAIELSDHELAARLSYVFLKSLPDVQLSEAAGKGALRTEPELLAQLARMLKTERGRKAMREFLEALIHLPSLDALVKDEVRYPAWKDGMPEKLRTQARRFFDHVLGEEDGSLSALLSSERARDDAHGAGLLTLPALLALQAKPDESAPIYRGKFVREVLLCMQLPAPPANIPKPPEVQLGVSTRERLRQHEQDPSCSGCHKLLDPIGFGLEAFDAVGDFRDDDGGKLVDARGELVSTKDANGTFVGAAQLARKLAASEQVQSCIAKQWFRFALARFEQPVDACAVESLEHDFASAQGSLHALPQAIVQSDAFRYRRPLVLEDEP